MPENIRPSVKTQVLQQIVRAQQDGLAKLRQAQLADQRYLLASQRIASLCFESLQLLDQMYSEMEEHVSRGGRSPHHQQWLEDRAAHLLKQLELGIDACVATGIRHLGNELSSPRQVIPEVVVRPTPACHKQFLAWRLGWLVVATTVLVIACAVLANGR